mmetsp:Transcript_17586/g.42359  ORF Transcript_17586/g.42359 Transcript_17586/m.42359 type:complete len:231 (+) Transcript_17586:304-996(+)
MRMTIPAERSSGCVTSGLTRKRARHVVRKRAAIVRNVSPCTVRYLHSGTWRVTHVRRARGARTKSERSGLSTRFVREKQSETALPASRAKGLQLKKAPCATMSEYVAPVGCECTSPGSSRRSRARSEGLGSIAAAVMCTESPRWTIICVPSAGVSAEKAAGRSRGADDRTRIALPERIAGIRPRPAPPASSITEASRPTRVSSAHEWKNAGSSNGQYPRRCAVPGATVSK